MAFTFNRGINPKFVERLNKEYDQGGWWRAIASDQKLFVAIRENYLNIYRNGCSLLKLSLNGERLVGEVHHKYLLQCNAKLPPGRRKTQSVVTFPDVSQLFADDLSILEAIKSAAAPYGKDEKKGVHQIVMDNPNVIDVEVAFRAEKIEEEDPLTPRIDFAALHTDPGAKIVFYEAKLFSNTKSIRADGDVHAPVLKQITNYGGLVRKHTLDLHSSYRTVCGNLIGLSGVRERYRTMLETMRQICSGETALQVDPSVCLVVFGYNKVQRDSAAWKKHRKKLRTELGKRLLLRGNSKGFRRGISLPL